MKRFKKILTSILAIGIFVTHATTVYATGDTAYCIGVNYSDSDTETYGDFRTNATNAKSYYNNISGMTALYSSTPTKAKINSHINDTVVFLNSHSNYDHIRFVNDAASTPFDCGVRIGSGNTKYVGLDDNTLSNAKLISFVGCLTAESGHSTNLVSNAVAKGADTAVGFSDTISSRTSKGKEWLNAYNGYLAQGRNVAYSIYNATSDCPDSNLGNSATIGGFPGTTIGPITYDRSNSGVTLNITVDFETGDKLYVSEQSLNSIIDQIKKVDDSFNIKEYRVTQNIFSTEYKTGLIKFDYYIEDLIKTNKSYVVFIENGIAKKLTYSLSAYAKNTTDVNEASLLTRIGKFSVPKSLIISNNIDSKEVVEHITEYNYDYKTNSLTYSETVFYLEESSGVIIDDYIEELIK